MTCANSEDSDQTVHQHSLIGVFHFCRAVEIKFCTCPMTSIQSEFTCPNIEFTSQEKKTPKLIKSDKDAGLWKYQNKKNMSELSCYTDWCR